MKRLFFLLICSILCLNLSAQWRRQYIPGDELKGIPSEWSYIYESGNKVVTFTDSGILMIVAKNQYFITTDEGFVPVLIGIYKNGNLLVRGKYAFTMLPEGHSCGLDGFREVLKLIRTSGAVIRIVAPLYNNFEFDITTTRMYVGSQVKFNQIKNEFKK